MGYTVYLLTSSKDDEILRRVFEDEEIKNNDHFSFHAPIFNGDDLAYAKDKHKGRTMFGLNFSAEYEFAHAVVATVARLLDRDKYWHDGAAMLKVQDAIWWHKPRSKLSFFRKLDLFINKSEYKEIDALLIRIRRKFFDAKAAVEIQMRRTGQSEC